MAGPGGAYQARGRLTGDPVLGPGFDQIGLRWDFEVYSWRLPAAGARIAHEEAFLANRFGDAWTEYARRTWRLVPGLS